MKRQMLWMGGLALALATPAWADGWRGRGCHGHGGMAMMHHADANGDGKVTKDEFMSAAKKRAQRMFAHMDANGDGVLDERDHEARFFDRMDANHDGMVSRAEFRAFHRDMHRKMMRTHNAKPHHSKAKGGHDD